MSLTPEAKKLLAETIRSLRDKLLRAISDEAERRYRLSVPLQKAGLDEAHSRRRERIEGWLDELARAQNPLCQRRLRQLPLDIFVLTGGEWTPRRAQTNPSA
ncbi:MAG: hypothetical protein RL701_5504 [Pseudomonadota bacterium]|jgi:hypothetical protein